MTGRDLLNIILNEGVEVEEDYKELTDEFDKALDEKRVYFIHKAGEVVGFLTHEEVDGKILINKCLINKEYRRLFNLVEMREELRKYLKEFYGDTDSFFWRSKRRSRFYYTH